MVIPSFYFPNTANDTLYVSKQGSLVSSACSSEDPCLSVTQAWKKELGHSRSIEVEVGEYEEAEGFSIEGGVAINGASRDKCFISKPSDMGFALFTLQADYAQLAITNFGIVLTNHSTEYNFFRAVSNHTNVLILIQSCHFFSRSGTVTGQTVYVNNENANVTLFECSVTDITVSLGPIVRTPIGSGKNAKSDGGIRSCKLRNCNFTNLTNTLPTARGTAFFMNFVAELSLLGCMFESCSSVFRGGIGHVYFLGKDKDAHKITNCTLRNCSAGEWFSGMYIQADGDSTITFTNTSCTQCTQAGRGVFTVYNNIVLIANNCLFMDCRSQSTLLGLGGALYIDSDSDAKLTRCAFVNCSAAIRGGALFFDYDGEEGIIDCVFIGNRVDGGDCASGDDIYISNSLLNVSGSCSDNGGLSVAGSPHSNGDTQLPVCKEESTQCKLKDGSSGNSGSCVLPCMRASDTAEACVIPRPAVLTAVCVSKAPSATRSPLLSTPVLLAIIGAGVVAVAVVVVAVVCLVRSSRRKANEERKIEANVIEFPAQPSATALNYDEAHDWDSVDDRISTTEMSYGFSESSGDGGYSQDNRGSDLGISNKHKGKDRSSDGEVEKRVEVYVETYRSAEQLELSTQSSPRNTQTPLPLPLVPILFADGQVLSAPTQSSRAGSCAGTGTGAGSASDTDSDEDGEDDENAEEEAEEVAEAEAEHGPSQKPDGGSSTHKHHKHHSKRKSKKGSKSSHRKSKSDKAHSHSHSRSHSHHHTPKNSTGAQNKLKKKRASSGQKQKRNKKNKNRKSAKMSPFTAAPSLMNPSVPTAAAATQMNANIGTQMNANIGTQMDPNIGTQMNPNIGTQMNMAPTEMVTIVFEGEEKKRTVPKGTLKMDNSNTEWLAYLVSGGRKEEKKMAEDM